MNTFAPEILKRKNSMKRAITIPQQAVVELGLDLDLADLAIFDFMCSFAHCQSCEKILTEDKQSFAYWFSAKLIQNQLPILRMQERTIKEHVANLVKCGLLQKYGDPRKMQKAFYTFGPLYDKIVFFNEHGVLPTQTDGRNLFSAPTSAENRRPLCENPQTPLRKSADNNNIEYNIVEEKMMEEKSASAPTPPPTQPSLFDVQGDDSKGHVDRRPSPITTEGAKKEKSSGQKERNAELDEYARRGVSAIKEPEEHAEQCLKDSIWMETMQMGGFSRELIEGKLREFVTHLRMEGKERKTISDFKSHFVRWMRKTAAIAKQQAQQPQHVVLGMEERMDIIRMTCNNFKK